MTWYKEGRHKKIIAGTLGAARVYHFAQLLGVHASFVG